MNTAARDRALLPAVKDVLGRTPVSKLALSKEKDGSLKVRLHTSRPNAIRMENQAITQALQDRIGVERALSVEVVPEARAVAKFLRTSPRKCRLVIDAIKGKRVSEALAMLRFIPNHAAEHIRKVLASAAANAQDGWGAGVDELKVVNILADGGPSLKRVRARAQGRAYRILKRTTHLTVILGDMPAPAPRPRRAASVPKAVKSATAPKSQTVREQAAEESALNAPEPNEVAEPSRQTPNANEGEGHTGDTANEPDTGQSQTPPSASLTPPAEQPKEATPVTASESPEEDTSDRAPDPSDGADQKREEGE
ncbi:MAG: 50S ribosomal protein L22 [Armatimonadetes bacterium]|nr:50S ribosomal protein L22 [Armatimonadota bacterium]